MEIPNNNTTGDRIVLILGDTTRAEMQPMIHWLRNLVSNSSRLMTCQNIECLLDRNSSPGQPPFKNLDLDVPVLEAVRSGEFPDLIIVLQSWPDEFSSRDVNQLLSFAPLARIVVVCGSWCESIGRTRNVWPMAVRIPIWAAPLRIQREWEWIQTSNSPDPPPWSASREEIFAFDHHELRNLFESETVEISAPDPFYRTYLHEMLHHAEVQIDQKKCSVLLFDADPLSPFRSALLQDYRNQNPQLTIVALVNQIDQSLTRTLLDLGATSIVAKLGFHSQIRSCFTDETYVSAD